AQDLGDPAVVVSLVETRPLQGSQCIPAEPLRRNRPRVEIQAKQLSTDQQPSVGKVAVRNCVGSNCGIDQRTGKRARQKEGGSALGAPRDQLTPTDPCRHAGRLGSEVVLGAWAMPMRAITRAQPTKT